MYEPKVVVEHNIIYNVFSKIKICLLVFTYKKIATFKLNLCHQLRKPVMMYIKNRYGQMVVVP